MGLWQVIEQYMRRIYQDNRLRRSQGSAASRPLALERSGHWAKYRDNMFTTESENRYYASSR